ncbi:MAG: hypothetical protein KDC92_17205, partial [Bacteroidetes bacterium]|nr:hypothetical protein [Bacteroidota bacterium]
MILRAFVFFSCLFTLQVVSAQTISNAESIIQKFESKLKIVKLPDNIKTEIRSAISTVHTSKAEFRNHKTTFFLCLSGAARLGPAQAAMGLCMDFRNFNLYLLTQLSAGFSADITQTLSILRKL